jgi:hypothetical protein
VIARLEGGPPDFLFGVLIQRGARGGGAHDGGGAQFPSLGRGRIQTARMVNSSKG